ncbi:hypothetical protein LZ645_19050 [Shewanella algae]|uniref:hypothetical protein n=2 Tax=Shewanella algae TaxID=38313 RepID=UPI001F1C4F12|nr:hypothetical protein [Shewanella algae]MCE9777038.1 hypothetical protein [Shewanella algae]
MLRKLVILLWLSMLVACSSIPKDWSGMSSTEIASWKEAGFDSRSAQQWHVAGFDASSAGAWQDAGFKLQDAKEWHLQSFSAAEAKGWRAGGFDLEDAMKNRAKGLTPIVDHELKPWGRYTEMGAIRAHFASVYNFELTLSLLGLHSAASML